MKIAVGFDSKASEASAHALAESLALPLDNEALMRLQVATDKLMLVAAGFSPLWVDFIHPSLQRRQQAGKKQGLIRACKPKLGLRVLDATAGWGRDAAILAGAGAQVLMLEKQPIMALLLRDGLRRLAIQDPSLSQRLSLLPVDAYQYLTDLAADEYFDVIYLDPMHPERLKSALVKKEMQLLQQLAEPVKDMAAFIQLARTKITQRVVVKWPQKIPPALPPNSSIPGKTIRFDIYHHKSATLA